MRQVTTWLLVAEADLERKGRAAYEVLLPCGKKLKLVLILSYRGSVVYNQSTKSFSNLNYLIYFTIHNFHFTKVEISCIFCDNWFNSLWHSIEFPQTLLILEVEICYKMAVTCNPVSLSDCLFLMFLIISGVCLYRDHDDCSSLEPCCRNWVLGSGKWSFHLVSCFRNWVLESRVIRTS